MRFERAPLIWMLCAGVAALSISLAATPAAAKLYLSRDAALEQVFGKSARIETRTVFLTPAQVREAEKSAAAKLVSPRVVLYRALRGDSLIGTAYLDTHPVRTLHETVLVAVNPKGDLRAVEVLAFQEPEDYLAPRRWLDLWRGSVQGQDLRPGGAVPYLSGATLTARAVSAAVRRTLALHAILARSPTPGAAR